MALLLAALLMQAKPPPLPKDETVLVKVVDKAKAPGLALDSDGNAYVVFSRNGNIEVAVSGDGGITFAAPVVALNTGGKDPGNANRPPRIAVDSSKRVYVSAPLEGGLSFVVSTDRGKSFGKPHVVAEPGSFADPVHAIAAGPGDLHVAWLSAAPGKLPLLQYAKFGADGKRAAKPLTIAGFPCEACPPAIAVDPKGQPTVAWREAAHDDASKMNRQIYITTSTDAGRSFPPMARLNSVDSGLNECPVEAPALAYASDGRTLAAAWMDRRDLEHDANIYWAFGPPGKFGRDTDPHDDRRYLQRRPTVAVEPDGTVWCAWEDGRLSGQRIFYATSKKEVNVPVGDAREAGSFTPCLAAGGARIALVYQLNDSIAFRLLK